ncbi:hypothetical protein CSPB12327_02170 [Campylobacter sp. RM12327]|uniref:hypothetical protein n=1 Tax=Campylobacter sputorum TaxID=206 RepID=UPI00053BF326|nr:MULTISPECIES: hypothetical protein [Campylobacter]ASM40658.1 hypothetical protein CSPB_1473 [Campylobacter sputorum]MBE7357677.1 hypothetical protein [Campylobacter sp. RM11302]MBF6668955.1 hypothetical protein [Campylobacter sp. RM12327]MBF6674036.1 hypothetical protein [Campylobacter sp. RM13538]MBF6675939.1 hypothetical protein [Campylobacter sp. RM12321]
MKRIILLINAFFILFIFSGCASIIKGGNPEVFSLNSKPSNADVTITDIKKNVVVVEEKTPFTISLSKSNGYFSKANYLVKVSKDGYKIKEFTIESKANGWYIGGNLVFGSIIGWLIVDPLTGAMYNLVPEKIDGVDTTDNNSITITLLSDLSKEDQLKVKKQKPIN